MSGFSDYKGRIVDTLVGLPFAADNAKDVYRTILAGTKDANSKELAMPAGYMFKHVPELGESDPVATLIAAMDRNGVDVALVQVGIDFGADAVIEAAAAHPDRIRLQLEVNPIDPVETVRQMQRLSDEAGIVAAGTFPAGTGIPLNDRLVYPVYAKCVELDIPFFSTAGVPGPRRRLAPQKVELIDDVMFDFPELRFVIRHGAEPWEELAVKLLLKWENLYYSPSAFAPKYYPRAIINFANTRGADKVMYAGYYPFGLTMERSMSELADVPFRDHVWPKFLFENARRVLRLDKPRS
ncbi:amidohydrolase family protein [Microbacterium sp. CPCC 204701]|uniref:amidohydrolase family protein n=1 Tax=Microbacterium sp. CPCC 204701 TaxID=2493084 RepID=UPI000FD7735F|nr:amidohydrolase family protein [Microbacterium sp. CPCC 204701]